jgi:hypothetical protein
MSYPILIFIPHPKKATIISWMQLCYYLVIPAIMLLLIKLMM